MTTVLLRLGAHKIKVETLLVIKVHQFSEWEAFYSGQVFSLCIFIFHLFTGNDGTTPSVLSAAENIHDIQNIELTGSGTVHDDFI